MLEKLQPLRSPAQEIQLQSLRSVTSRLDPHDHEINLEAITSQPLSLNEVGQQLTLFQKQLILAKLNYEKLESLDDLPVGAVFFIEKVQNLPIEESIQILKDALVEHRNDSNFPEEDYQFIESLLSQPKGNLEQSSTTGGVINDLGKDEKVFEKATNLEHSLMETSSINVFQIVDWELQVKLEAAIFAYYSPYPEVRAVTDPYDDPSTPCETLRAYVVALVWTVIGSFINEFFAHRMPAIGLSTAVVQLFLYPSGKLLELIIPNWTIPISRTFSIQLNPGPWSIKEQQLCSIFYSISSAAPYVDSNIYVQKLAVFYNNTWVTFGYQVLLILSTQFIGFGISGILRKFTIYPVKALWPNVFPTLALNRALLIPERKETINGWKISRYYFFFLVTGCSFIYNWVPIYLFTSLSTFNWMTWIAPDNFKLAAITGSSSGLGLNPIPTFDWNILNSNFCLTIPFYSQINQYMGSLIAFIVIVALYWTNNKWTAYLPINSNYVFDNTGNQYATTSVIGSNNELNEDMYKKMGPPYFSAANLVVYGAFFALYLFAFFYQIITEWKQLSDGAKNVFLGFKNWRRPVYENYTDAQSRMMSKYKEVPDWVYLIVLVIAFLLAVLCVELYPVNTPVWAIVLMVLLNFVFLIPITSIYSITGFKFGLNVLAEIIVGYIFPGQYLPLITLKAFGYNTDGQAMAFISDLKTAHYAKIPPRAVFRAQLLSTFVCCFITLAVINFQLGSVKDICTHHQKQKFSCPGDVTYYSSSIQFGLIGPRRMFDQVYPILKWCFLIGLLLVIPALAFKKFGPRRLTKHFQPTAIIGGMLVFAPYNLAYYTGGVYLSFAFMHHIRKRYLTWWEKYNYVFSSAMDAGVAFSAIIIFFAVQYHEKDVNWWGNTVSYEGIDGGIGQQSLLNVSNTDQGYFGLKWGTFS
ncbi:oligopeptide transporter 2 [[Candida] anglica]|uniref:Oligopeptide transporter 2 n=1 Tax=[Candida] anglica TaxID=148631 RepID=A0ABP0EIY1_9ASCO